MRNGILFVNDTNQIRQLVENLVTGEQSRRAGLELGRARRNNAKTHVLQAGAVFAVGSIVGRVFYVS
jgi:hypothetical protein